MKAAAREHFDQQVNGVVESVLMGWGVERHARCPHCPMAPPQAVNSNCQGCGSYISG